MLEAFGLYLVRTSVLVLGTPILGSGTGFAGYKIALSRTKFSLVAIPQESSWNAAMWRS